MRLPSLSLPPAPPADIADTLVCYLVDTPEGPVGVFDGFERDERGRPATMIVSQGWFGRRRFLVPIEQLAEIDHFRKRIILAPGAAPIERRGPLSRLMDLGESPYQQDAEKAFDDYGWSPKKRRPVLCGLGEAEPASVAVSVAAELANGLGAPLILATPSHRAPDAAARTGIATQTIDALLSSVAEGTHVIRITATEPHTLVELASDVGACFLVVLRGEGTLTASVTGGVAGDHLCNAPCPVVLVPAAEPAAFDRQSDTVVAAPAQTDDFSLCPTCGRVTRTIRRGACADCWQSKTPEGASVFRPLGVRPSSIQMPTWTIATVIAAVALGLAVAVGLLSF